MLFLGDHEVAVKRVAELEGALQAESAKSKKLLDQAEQHEIDLLQAEKTEVARLPSLATHVGGKFFTSFARMSDGWLIILPCITSATAIVLQKFVLVLLHPNAHVTT